MNINKYIKNLSFELTKKDVKEKDLLDIFIKFRTYTRDHYQFYEIINLVFDEKYLLDYGERINNSLRNGEKISQAFKKSGLKLRDIDFIVLEVSEESGKISNGFEIVEKRIKNSIELKEKIKKLLFYPAVVFLFIIFILYILGSFVLPSFINILYEMKVEVSLTTKIIIYFGNNIIKIILGTIFFLSILKIFIFKNIRENEIFNFIIKIRFIKKIINEIFIINFLTSLVLLIDSGIMISSSVEIFSKEIKIEFYKNKLRKILKNFKKGRGIYESFEDTKLFSKWDLGFIKLGEKSGEIVENFRFICERKKSNLENLLDKCIKLIEPITILVMGGLIILIFSGIYFPMLNLMENI